MKDTARKLTIATILSVALAAPALAHKNHYRDRVYAPPGHYLVDRHGFRAVPVHRGHGKKYRKKLRRLYDAHARWHWHNDHRRDRWYHREHRRLHRSMGIEHWYFVDLGWRSPVRYRAYRW
ncbi:MAG: hypothetical protein R3315_05060 [Woeseiaceae bacterium]|nr:hypothetical protein [Woeseiaceae bacterium]